MTAFTMKNFKTKMSEHIKDKVVCKNDCEITSLLNILNNNIPKDP